MDVSLSFRKASTDKVKLAIRADNEAIFRLEYSCVKFSFDLPLPVQMEMKKRNPQSFT